MPESHLFYRYYDTLFATKNYASEVAAVFDYCEKLQLQPLKNILEVGCGTGSHTLLLTGKVGVHVTAVDTDPAMLALAKIKAGRSPDADITFAAGCFAVHNADLCVALFNVVNYICELDALSRFFAEIASSLRPQGLFFFDCWNGTAALLDPPGSKIYEQECNEQTVRCQLTSRTDFEKKLTTMDYHLELIAESGATIEVANYKLIHRLWTPAEIRAALQKASLVIEKVCLPFRFAQAATDSDWKIMFVCRKP